MKSFNVFCVSICFIGTMALLYNFGLGFMQMRQNIVATKVSIECRKSIMSNRYYGKTELETICGSIPEIEGIL